MKLKFLLVCLLVILLSLTGCGTTKSPAPQEPLTKDFFAMDTHMRVTVYSSNTKLPDLAEVEIKRLDKLLSAHSTSSELAQLQKERTLVVSEATAKVLEQALKINKETNGAFDITLGPVSKLWGFPNGPYHIPTDSELKTALAKTGTQKIQWDSKTRTCKLIRPEVSIDLGGIAKGYAAECAADVLVRNGCQNAVLNLGGNIKVIGKKPDNSPWHIGIQHPDIKDEYLGVLSTGATSIVTSGDYERYFEQEGVRYHHILNPQTGLPATNGLRSVTIICPDSMVADSLSTALFVLGPKKALAYWQAHKSDFQMLLYTTAGKLLISEGLANSFETKLPYSIVK